MLLNEIVKNVFTKPHDAHDKESSSVQPQNIISDLTNNDLYPNTGAFFDSEQIRGGLFGNNDITDTLFKQKEHIMKYRNLAMTTDVDGALDDIVNEIVFSYDDTQPIKIDINEENEKLVSAITEKFEKILKLINVKRNLFHIVKNSYVDGQLVIHCAYDKNTTKNGIKAIKMIEPCMFYFDRKSKTHKYLNDEKDLIIQQEADKEYSIEEIVKEDFGLYDKNLILSYLEKAIKPANMLQTLEDLLIPMRFSRSISRRVFNVDIGDLPSKRGAEVMRDYQGKFKYKKFYNNETGEVSNQQHITSMVEDYWFANRSGGKGTTVDVLDETGNLGELNDILYMAKKLYQSLNIPNNRISVDPEADHEFDYESTRVSKDDMKFFMFISRIRQVYSSAFKEILKREVITTGVMTEAEWNDKEELIGISFVNENKFIEKMKLDNFMSKLEIYSTAQEYQGKLFSVEKILKDVFRVSDDEIEDEFKKIQQEEKDPKYAKFYAAEDEESKW